MDEEYEKRIKYMDLILSHKDLDNILTNKLQLFENKNILNIQSQGDIDLLQFQTELTKLELELEKLKENKNWIIDSNINWQEHVGVKQFKVQLLNFLEFFKMNLKPWLPKLTIKKEEVDNDKVPNSNIYDNIKRSYELIHNINEFIQQKGIFKTILNDEELIQSEKILQEKINMCNKINNLI